jgi:hypothetical protein
MKRLASMAAGLTVILGATVVLATDASADPRAPAIAALPGAAPVFRLVAPASTSTGELDSLTRAEALHRLQAEGFTTVTRLVRDSEGNWIGAAQRGNRIVDIAVDQDGDVIAW